MLIGHMEVVAALTEQFPSAALLWGPPSVGKTLAAEQVRRAHKIFEPDVLRIRRLGVPEARTLIDFASRAASTPAGKVAIVQLDGADRAATDALLKVTEDVHPGMHFLLVASEPIAHTLWDRAQVYPFGLLTQAQVAEFLRTQRGMSAVAAERLAEQSGGQVRGALEALHLAETKAPVLAAVRALRENDPDGLESLAERWRDEHTVLLVRWAHEAVSLRWRTFNDAETGEVGSLPLRVLLALRREARPRLLVRSVLMDLLERG